MSFVLRRKREEVETWSKKGAANLAAANSAALWRVLGTRGLRNWQLSGPRQNPIQQDRVGVCD